MRTARAFLAGAVVGISASGAVWLYTYRAHDLIRFIDTNGVEYNDPRRVSVQPWWGVYAALALLAVGLAAAVSLLPSRTTRRGELRSLRALDPR